MQHVGKILPIDGYQVQLYRSLPTDYLASLTHLYQPLLGIEAISLYQLLLQEIEIQDEHALQTHHTLMNYLNLSLDKIYEARIKLEGIGLVKTYKKQQEQNVLFQYMLVPPFRPAAFFEDIMLSEFLYRQLGQMKFTTLKERYATHQNVNPKEEVTAMFSDVFQTFHPEGEPYQPVAKEEVIGVPVDEIDFSLLSQSLKRRMIPVMKVLTERNRRIIAQVQQLYGLKLYQLEQAINWALTDENELDIEQFQAACEDLFRESTGGIDVNLAMKQAEAIPAVNEVETETDQSIRQLASISTKDLLNDLSEGDHAGEQDLKMVSEIMVKQGLPTPVMNVLITYVMHQTNNQLSRPYLEKIASHWSRMNFKTAKEAMNYILHPPEKRSTKRKNNTRGNQSTEVIPDWFKERKQQNSNEKIEVTEQERKAHEEMMAMLEQFDSKEN